MVEEGERKESRRREKGLGRVEPGNTSLKEVNFITTLLSRQNTRHQTRAVLFHGCPAPPKQHMAELVEEWCHGQHNELWSALLCALCCMGGGKKKSDRKAVAKHKDTHHIICLRTPCVIESRESDLSA